MCMMHGQLSWGSYCRPLGVRLWIEPLLQCRICMASGPQECTRLRWLSQSSKNEGHTCTNVQKTALSLSQVLIALPNKLLHGRKRWYFQNWIWSAKSLWTHYGTHTHTHLAFHLEGCSQIVQPDAGHEPRPGVRKRAKLRQAAGVRNHLMLVSRAVWNDLSARHLIWELLTQRLIC